MAMKLGKVLLVASGSLLIGALISACGGGSEESHTHIEEGAHQGTNVQVVMEETWEAWTFVLDRTEVPAGEVTFEVTNEGKFEHELMIYPSQDLSPLLEEMVEAAQTGAEAAHGEEEAAHGEEDVHGEEENAHGEEEAAHGEEIEGLVASAEGEDELVLAPDESGSLTVSLTPGTYELGCLIVEMVGEETFTHHEKGMHTTLTVQ